MSRFTDESAGDPVLALDEYYEQGYDLVSSTEAQAAFDIHREPAEVRDFYGRHGFGQRRVACAATGGGRGALCDAL